MGKAEKGTPKALANKIKSKGLQKLKWFCQMCQKQCRDQNGFKCHLTSEAHQRQLLLFAENENSYLKEFSREFEGNFMRILRNTFGSKRVRANDVYQEYIKDKGHVHMNSTVWHTLTGFVQYLESSGKCRIDQNEKGWHVQLIDQEEELRKSKVLSRAKQEKTDEDKLDELLQRQMEKAMQRLKEEDLQKLEPEELKREDDSEKISFSFKPTPNASEEKPVVDKVKWTGLKVDTKKEEKPCTSSSKSHHNDKKQKRSALDDLISDFKDKRKTHKDYWIQKDIMVKIVTKQLGSKYYNAKGRVVSVIDKYVAEVEVDDGDVIRLDQRYLETVIPKSGRKMMILNGAYAGMIGVLEEILQEKFAVRLKIVSGSQKGDVVDVLYEDASKLFH